MNETLVAKLQSETNITTAKKCKQRKTTEEKGRAKK